MMSAAGSVNIILSSRHRARRMQKFTNNRELKTVHRTWNLFKLLRFAIHDGRKTFTRTRMRGGSV